MIFGMSSKHQSRQLTMAIAYDFDGTLAPGNMQEYRFLPEIGLKPKDFWRQCNDIAREQQADEVLVYMNLMLRKANEKSKPVRKEDFREHGKNIELFEGVKEWFPRINEYAQSRGIEIYHYLISSGNLEIFEGTEIAGQFKAIYASKYLFDANGVAVWPALAINYTTKTQFLFRINKGVEDISDNVSINKYTPNSDRPVPFENMIFIGDGASDIPCFRLVKEQGGFSIAVYVPNKQSKAKKYLKDGRVQAVAPADYRDGARLDKLVKARIDLVAARHALDTLLTE